jgi:O-antigen/teichoic acid export membrane protein
MRRYAVPLFVANAVALATIGISYLLYSRLLSANQFGVYSAALAVGNLGMLVLDGGVKVSIIKRATPPTPGEERALLQLMLCFSLILLLALILLRRLIVHFYPVLSAQAGFVASFTGVYLLTYPWIGLSTAQLERRLHYSRLAWIESTGLVLERGAPAAILYFTGAGMYAFVWGLALGRLLRVAALAWNHSVALGRCPMGSYQSAAQLIKEGAWYQLGVGSSLVRDNLHVVLLGPLYGSAWVGYYAWGLQLCVLASQIFVQISARISIPMAAQRPEFQDRWSTTIRQVGLLTAITAPILAAAIIAAPSAVHHLFADKWRPAVILLPYLFLRMLPGAASAPMGALALVEQGAKSYAGAAWLWTLVELAAGAAALRLLGPEGLAISYAVTAWFGIYFLVRALKRQTFRLFSATASAIFARPALWASLLVATPCALVETPGHEWLSNVNLAWTLASAALLVASFYAADPGLRSTLLRGRR